ncbi:MAG: hypothetical protein CVV52_00380 [Spirochaetae bacterium HGW-Spirochaetae-8]|jgi:hypothetical protein|nr:MAG: hypothetical protein CVV52_00380 [Spirochaetae bacterium HGW-Spirochaetae-8]
MKKLFVILVLVLMFVSCTLEFHDEDGFRLFQFGWTLGQGQALVQSHDGFRICDRLYNEAVVEKTVTIENVLNRTIDVRITDIDGQRWAEVDPLGSLDVE